MEGSKENKGSTVVQQEINLLDADKETLEQCYKHCTTMLNNVDEKET